MADSQTNNLHIPALLLCLIYALLFKLLKLIHINLWLVILNLRKQLWQLPFGRQS